MPLAELLEAIASDPELSQWLDEAMDEAIDEMFEDEAEKEAKKALRKAGQQEADSMDAPAGAQLRLQYRLINNGDQVGTLETWRSTREEGGQANLLQQHRLRIHSEGFLFSYRLDADEKMLIAPDGLRNYINSAKEDGERSSIVAGLDAGVMKLRLEEDGVKQYRFQQSEYDATSEDAAQVFLAGGQSEAVMRVLDLEHAKIDQIRYHRLPDETLELAGQRFQTRVLSFASTLRKASGRQWYAAHSTGDVLVREYSQEPGEKNECILQQWM
ncbi:hypothetical protein V8J88_06495 [Massilia sp. W12]|uniref:hypothetical protein n=1 Tax=Massilia sp. W12 TaxID=3126507 RepID=UPI0030CDB144